VSNGIQRIGRDTTWSKSWKKNATFENFPLLYLQKLTPTDPVPCWQPGHEARHCHAPPAANSKFGLFRVIFGAGHRENVHVHVQYGTILLAHYFDIIITSMMGPIPLFFTIQSPASGTSDVGARLWLPARLRGINVPVSATLAPLSKLARRLPRDPDSVTRRSTGEEDPDGSRCGIWYAIVGEPNDDESDGGGTDG